MTGLFPDHTSTSREEHEAFKYLLKKILTQMETHSFEPSLRTSILFSFLIGTPRTACNGLKLQLLSLEEMLYDVGKNLFRWINQRRSNEQMEKYIVPRLPQGY